MEASRWNHFICRRSSCVLEATTQGYITLSDTCGTIHLVLFVDTIQSLARITTYEYPATFPLIYIKGGR